MEHDNLQSIAEVMSQLSNCQGLELLPYHAYGGSKYKQLGLEDNTKKDWIPTPSELEMAKGKLRSLGVT
ncbi:MAG: hypothetical protein GX815_13020, partial [Clostridiales bacterium]|nr:hypothetical protein [Clostridiales bacterium]